MSIAYARRFGAANEKLEAMLRAAASGGATSADLDIAKLAVAAVTGRVPQRYGTLATLRNLVFFVGNLVLMPFSVFSSLAEPLTAGLRSTYMRDSIRALTTNISTMVRSGRREDLAELGRVIGLVNNALRDGYMENRTNADSMGMGRTWSALLARFYQANLLSPLTNFQRIAMQPVAHAIIVRHLRTSIAGGRGAGFANGELNELGIGASDRPDLLQWLDGLDGLPSPEDLLAPDGGFYNQAAALWASAVVRLTDSIIQNPQKADRPILANDPTYAALYSITSFLSAFQRNIINRTLTRHLDEKATLLGKGTRAFQNLLVAAAPLALYFAGQFLASTLREALLNPAAWQQHDDDGDLWDWLLQKAFDRSNLTGVAGPLIAAYQGLKYDRDLSNALVGPYPATFLKNLESILKVVAGRNDASTRTAENNAAQAAYRLAVQPALATTVLALGPTAGLSSLLFRTLPLFGLSSTASRQGFADAVVGPKPPPKHLKAKEKAAPWWAAE